MFPVGIIELTCSSIAFKEDPDHEKEVLINVGMMRRVVRAIRALSTNFQFFVYPGGTRVSLPCPSNQNPTSDLTPSLQGYGIYLPNGVFNAPLVEEMADTLPADYLKTVSYPHYRTMLTAESASQSWSWSEVVPDAIIGFTPNGSSFSLAGHWAVYLYAWKLVYGEGANVPFPGTQEGYESLCTEASAGLLARVAIHASLNKDMFRERIFNVADSAEPSSMSVRWPQVAGWFGLKGTAPIEGPVVKPSEFIKEHEGRLREEGVKGVDIWNAAQLDSYGYWLTFDRQLSLERLRNAGFTEEKRPEEGWWEAFEMFKRASMIK
jgi:hypothetical protein